jgi:hypothetical protein
MPSSAVFAEQGRELHFGINFLWRVAKERDDMVFGELAGG